MSKKQLSVATIKKWLINDDWHLRVVAMNTCKNRDVSLNIIKQGLNDNDCDVRAAAMKACQGRDISLDIIKQGLNDDNWIVRKVAIKYIKDNNIKNVYVPYRAIDTTEKNGKITTFFTVEHEGNIYQIIKQAGHFLNIEKLTNK